MLDSSPHWCWSPSISTLSKTASSSDTFHGEAEFQNLILLAVVNLHKAGDGKLGQKIKGKMIPVTLKSKVNLLMCSGSLHLFLHKQWCSSHSKGLFPALENWFCTDLNGLIETLNRNSLLLNFIPLLSNRAHVQLIWRLHSTLVLHMDQGTMRGVAYLAKR